MRKEMVNAVMKATAMPENIRLTDMKKIVEQTMTINESLDNTCRESDFDSVVLSQDHRREMITFINKPLLIVLCVLYVKHCKNVCPYHTFWGVLIKVIVNK